MLHTSYLEISRSALEQNLKFLKQTYGPDCRFSSVVKGNAYGHGIEIFVPLAESCGVDHFSVFSAYEADRVQRIADNDPTIMIMGMVEDDQVEWAVRNGIEFYVFNRERLETAIAASKSVGKKALIHLEAETGMNRTGIEYDALPELIDRIRASRDHIVFKGLCTHFAGAESIANHYRIQHQQKTFRKFRKRLEQAGMEPQILHTACSAASIRYPLMRMDMVRIGILQYGFFPSREVLVDYLLRTKTQADPLRRMISWKSRIMDVKAVKTGEFIGYGTSFLANHDMKIASIPVGYSHGFNRALSNQGRVLIRGERVSVIGIVNMNMMTVDVTTVESVERGDEVVLIGRQEDMEITVSSFSEFSEQVNYELLTRLPRDLPRIIVD